MPATTILQPCNAEETRAAVRYFLDDASGVCVLRLIIGPSPRQIELPADYRLTRGRGVTLRDGQDALLFAYGPVMLHEALTASERLAETGFGLAVVNMPWLNVIDDAWLADLVREYTQLAVVEDHAPTGALGDVLLQSLSRLNLGGNRTVRVYGVEGFPACGTPLEALRHHGLDGESLARRIVQQTGRPATPAAV